MKKSTRQWLTAGAVLTVIGLLIFAAAMTANHWDFTRLGTETFVTNIYTFDNSIQNISMDTETADILFAVSDDGMCRVVCYENENVRHLADVQNGTLTVTVKDDRTWQEHIGIGMHTPKVTVYLPGTAYASLSVNGSTGDIEVPDCFSFDAADIRMSTGDVSFSASSRGQIGVHTSTGDIRIRNTAAGALDLSVSTGEISVSGVVCEGDIRVTVTTGQADMTDTVCRNLISTGSTGDMILEHVTATEAFSIERSTGDVRLDGADAAELFIKTSTGNVSGTLLTDKIYVTDTSTGSVHVPGSKTGGICEIITSTGDINIR